MGGLCNLCRYFTEFYVDACLTDLDNIVQSLNRLIYFENVGTASSIFVSAQLICVEILA